MTNFFGLTKEKAINKVYAIPVSDIFPNPNQPRKFFSEDELEQLSESITHNGILQPITVRKCDNGYELISGERRWYRISYKNPCKFS